MIATFLVLLTTAALATASPAVGLGPGVRHPLTQKPEVGAALTVLDASIAATVVQREQPGPSIGIVCDQDLIGANGYGHADLERRVAATPTTVYRIASISKLCTTSVPAVSLGPRWF